MHSIICDIGKKPKVDSASIFEKKTRQPIVLNVQKNGNLHSKLHKGKRYGYTLVI